MLDDNQKQDEKQESNKSKIPEIKTFSVPEKDIKEVEISEDLFSIRKDHKNNENGSKGS